MLFRTGISHFFIFLVVVLAVANGEGYDGCPQNEVYNSCGTACPTTCKNLGAKINCIAVCRDGCFCKSGYVRNDAGKCIPSRECPKSKCSELEEYNTCGTACPKTCRNLGVQISCIALCKEGCFCKSGYVRNDAGKCVRPEQCPNTTCLRKNEEYQECGTLCPRTCENYGYQIRCIAGCNATCFCKEGYIRRKDGECVKPEQCIPAKCPPNSEYKECGTACQQTCDNYGALFKCTADCKKGCFCKEGYIRKDNETCVKPEQCIEGGCPANEVYTTCEIPCDSCEVRGNCQFKACYKGCNCKTGYYRNKRGVCIPESSCPVPCKTDERYYECKPTCNNTCENYNKNRPCRLICGSGCDCREGLIRRKEDNACVKPKDCDAELCPVNEVYSTCVNPCNDCYTKGNCQFLVCNSGCDCVEGYYRDNSGVCIPEYSCPSSECSELEEYSSCGTACPRTCRNLGVEISCIDVCKEGCFCKSGYVRNDAGTCVRTKQCPKNPCPENQEYQECGTLCPRTCDNYGYQIRCIAGCKTGCFCKEGYIRKDNKTCVVPEQCIEGGCGVNEEYTTCEIPCDSCQERGECDFPFCNKGCNCKTGYYRNKRGVCIPERSCPVRK